MQNSEPKGNKYLTINEVKCMVITQRHYFPLNSRNSTIFCLRISGPGYLPSGVVHINQRFTAVSDSNASGINFYVIFAFNYLKSYGYIIYKLLFPLL
jgi:hypothetical protein